MKQWYKLAGAMMMAAFVVGHVAAQTQYGTGSGTVGTFRAFFGTDAGKINTGAFNTFLGHEAGAVNFKGYHNAFVGYQAGNHNTNGNGNVFIGSYAGLNNTVGYNNSFMGKSAGMNNTQGYANTFVGMNAGFSNDGVANVFIGMEAGYLDKKSAFSTIIGTSAGYNNQGHKNTFIGYGSGYSNTSGEDNTFVGNHTGTVNNTGTFNTFIGSFSGYSNDAGTANIFVGNKSGYSTKNGNNNAFLGYGAGYDNVDGEKNTYLGYNSGGTANLTNATAVGAQAKVTVSNALILGNNANVGIGISAPIYQLQLSTNFAAKTGTSSWIIASDQRLKKDISDYKDGLEVLKQIKPVWFSYNGDAGIKDDGKKFVGVIAQDMQKIAPYTVGTFNYQDSSGNKTEYLDYDAGAVTYMLVNSVKEQQEIIDQKEAKIQEITATVAELTKRLEQLERIVASVATKPTLIGNPAAKTGTEPNSNGVILEQNTPNGFSQSTSIHFFIPQSVKEAVMNIYSTDGVKVGAYPVADRGQASLTISAKSFHSGVFIYDLITDGKSNGAKKMVVTQ